MPWSRTVGYEPDEEGLEGVHSSGVRFLCDGLLWEGVPPVRASAAAHEHSAAQHARCTLCDVIQYSSVRGVLPCRCEARAHAGQTGVGVVQVAKAA